jgi:Ricin-type beta-trefoil lectin domain/PAN domain
MRVVRRRPRALLTHAVAILASLLLAAPIARAASVKEVFEKHDLMGTLAADCGKTGDAHSRFLVVRAMDADHVQIDWMAGPTSRESVAIVDKASESKPDEITLSATIDDQQYEIVVRVEAGRLRTMERVNAKGEKQVTNGRVTKDGKETLTYGRCRQRVTIHSAPEAGGRCIEALNGDIKVGVRLQMRDCNDTPPQIFAFDNLSGRLTIGDLCVDTVGGLGQEGVQLPLAICNGAASQTWKVEPNGKYVKLVGLNGLCIDIADFYKENRAALKLWHCHGKSNQSWQLYPALDLTWDEEVRRDGHVIGQFNLAAADARLCQMSCIEIRQCTAWRYRKPEGRNDHNPYCWLLDKTEKVNGDALVVSGTVRPEAK